MRMRVLVVAVLVLGAAGCSDPAGPGPDATGTGSAAPASRAPTTSADAATSEPPPSAEPGIPGEPTATGAPGDAAPWAFPDVADEIARAVIVAGSGESVISGTATAGQPLTLRVACRETSSAAEAGYALVDARVDQEGALEERTFLRGTAPCDGQEHGDGLVAAGFTGPVQVMLTVDAGGSVDGYAILSSS